MNRSGIKVAGHRLLVLPEAVEEVTESGIVIHHNVTEREQMAQCEGQVVSVGSCAYADQKEPWCQVSDRVVFSKYSGIIRKGKDGKEYRIIADLEVLAVLEEGA